MGFRLTTTQAAEFLSEQLAVNGYTPSITEKKVHAQVKAGLFINVGAGKQVRIDSDALLAFTQKTRYIQNPEEIDSEIFRVSVLERQERSDPILERGTTRQLSDFMGVDYSNPQLLDGIEGVWEASDINCDFMVASKCTFMATCKGYVHPEHVRTVVDWVRIENSSRKYFRTTLAPEAVRKVVGTGLWIDVPPGRESDFLVKNER
ncbi:hypothetical protein ABIE52_006731 [Rhodococcus sp. OAS809]|uniref:helix-turn-helix domain-containing protein n=1 Tax=Rhodococcus sp. OAS809 TaxID=2663874 RepID=UPI00178B7EB2